MSEEQTNKNQRFQQKYKERKLNGGVTNYYGYSNVRNNKYNIPVFAKMGESLEFIGGHWNGRATHFKGMFIPISIEHGENFDLLEGKFGLTQIRRQIIVSNNHARRQLLTVKIGQWCEVFGEARLYLKDNKLSDGSTRKTQFWGLYAMAINGWYLPRSFDVKQREEDIASGEEKPYGEMTKEKEQFFQSLIDDVFKERINIRNDDEYNEQFESDIDMEEEE